MEDASDIPNACQACRYAREVEIEELRLLCRVTEGYWDCILCHNIADYSRR